MTRKDGIQIFIGERLDHIDDRWWLYSCTYLRPPYDGDEIEGFIEGDGDHYEMDSLTDEKDVPV